MRNDQTGELYGLIVTYVDELLFFGEGEVIQVLHRFILEEK